MRLPFYAEYYFYIWNGKKNNKWDFFFEYLSLLHLVYSGWRNYCGRWISLVVFNILMHWDRADVETICSTENHPWDLFPNSHAWSWSLEPGAWREGGREGVIDINRGGRGSESCLVLICIFFISLKETRIWRVTGCQVRSDQAGQILHVPGHSYFIFFFFCGLIH